MIPDRTPDIAVTRPASHLLVTFPRGWLDDYQAWAERAILDDINRRIAAEMAVWGRPAARRRTRGWPTCEDGPWVT